MFTGPSSLRTRAGNSARLVAQASVAPLEADQRARQPPRPTGADHEHPPMSSVRPDEPRAAMPREQSATAELWSAGALPAASPMIARTQSADCRRSARALDACVIPVAVIFAGLLTAFVPRDADHPPARCDRHSETSSGGADADAEATLTRGTVGHRKKRPGCEKNGYCDESGCRFGHDTPSFLLAADCSWHRPLCSMG